MAEQSPGRERTSINPAGARPQLCVILGRKGGYSEQGLSQLLEKARQWRGGPGGGMACRRGTPFPGETVAQDLQKGRVMMWKMRFRASGLGVGLCPNPCCLRVDRPVLPWQPDRRLTAKREPFYVWTLAHSGSPQCNSLELYGSRDQAPRACPQTQCPGAWDPSPPTAGN